VFLNLAKFRVLQSMPRLLKDCDIGGAVEAVLTLDGTMKALIKQEELIWRIQNCQALYMKILNVHYVKDGFFKNHHGVLRGW